MSKGKPPTKCPFFMNLEQAHIKAGAPGKVIGFWGDGRYNVRLQYGTRTFRFRTYQGSDKVTVICNWSIDGQRQRKQATVP